MNMNLFDENKRPLADLVRPQSLDEMIGQLNIIGSGQFVRSLVESKHPVSMILWGPPGTGKTTLARIIAHSSNSAIEELSAVTSGLPDVKKVIERARQRKIAGGSTVLFVDEIHRFNKAQQDAFLPHMENGTFILIGATTENPSFEVIGPLLSRSRVIILNKLSEDNLIAIINRGVTTLGNSITPDAAELLAKLSSGDARSALGGLEAASILTTHDINAEHVLKAMQKPVSSYDKNGSYHYDIISAFIKSMRGGDADAALIYLARMIKSGEDAKFIIRRMVIFASEDIGTADNTMLALAISASQAIERVGMPEGRIILSHVVIALSKAPKNRSAENGINNAQAAIETIGDFDVPLHLRNGVTSLMKDEGFGAGYKWEAGFHHSNGFRPENFENIHILDTEE